MIIHFLNGNDEIIQKHYLQKEYRDDIYVELNNSFYEVYFYTETALKYEFREQGYFTLPGIILLEEISHTKIISALTELKKVGFFDSFVGIKQLVPSNRFIQKLYFNDISSFDLKKKSILILSS